MRFDKVIISQHRELNHNENSITESIFDSISNIVTVIILRAEKMVCTVIYKKINKPYELYKKHSINIELKWFLTSMCCHIMTVLVLGIYFWQHIDAPRGVLTASLYLLIKYLSTISDLFYQFTHSYGDIIKHFAKVSNAEELTKDFIQKDASHSNLPNNWNTISVSGLSFSYEGKTDSKYQLKDVSIEINKGEKIACIGKTGSGKTTLLKIIRGLYEISAGEILVDGILQNKGFVDACGKISLIPQDADIFATTVLANITFAKEDEFDNQEVHAAIQVACFKEVLELLPNGLHTSMNERGVNLSGGQKQRLALARGIYASTDAQIILLDEPTSSLDPLTEHKVYQNIFEHCLPNVTIISTVHRMHLLPMFDKIIFFDKGKVITVGTFEEIRKNEKFIKMIGKIYKQEVTT